MFFSIQFCRRGLEGIEFLTKEHFGQYEFEGLKYWKKIKGESSKNHPRDSEDLRKGSFMLHEENDFGFNPGAYFELWLSKTDTSQFMFCTPKQPSKQFKIRSNPVIWYTKNKIGVNKVAEAMPKISKAADLRHLTNHQLRATAINSMIDAGIEDREIVTVSGHKNKASIENYAKKPSIKKQLAMSRAISNGGNPKKPRLDDTAGSEEPVPSTSNAARNEEPLPSTSKADMSSSSSIVKNSKKSSSSSKVKNSKKNSPKSATPEGETDNNCESADAAEDTFDDNIDSQFLDENDLVLTQVEEAYALEKFLKEEQELAAQRMKLAEKCFKARKK